MARDSGPHRTRKETLPYTLPPISSCSLPLFAYSTLIWDPGGCVGRSNVLTQRFKMSFKSHSALLGLFYFPHVRLQGQFAPTADERSIGDLNLKSRGPWGRSVAGACCCRGGESKPRGSTETYILPPPPPQAWLTLKTMINSWWITVWRQGRKPGLVLTAHAGSGR